MEHILTMSEIKDIELKLKKIDKSHHKELLKIIMKKKIPYDENHRGTFVSSKNIPNETLLLLQKRLNEIIG